MADGKQPDSTAELTPEVLAKLVETANSGDKAAMSRLRQILDHNPEIWRAMGDLGAIARTSLVGAIAGNDRLLMESLQRKAADMQQTLVGPNATPLEKLAAERVVIVWLQLQQADLRCAHPDASSIGWAGFWSAVQERAQRRYESAIRHLQTVQKAQGRKPTSRVPAQPTGSGPAGSSERTVERPPRGKASGSGIDKEAQVPAPRTAAAFDLATTDDVAAPEAVVPFTRPGNAAEIT